MCFRELFNQWCDRVSDPVLKAELNEMNQSGDEACIEDAFYQTLEFGTAGLRGVLGAGTNRMNIYTVGQATQGIANYIMQLPSSDNTVAICYDSRINSELFAHTAAAVLAANGIRSFVYPRLEPTPALSFATRYLKCAIGINVTASHNPSKYNGYKVYGPDGCQITAEIADAITNAIVSVDIFDDVKTMDFDEALNQGLVSFIDEKVLDAFLDAVYEQSVYDKDPGNLKLVYTPLNGTGLECVTKILNRIGVSDIHVVEEQAQPDGSFPTCPYPNPENRDALEKGIDLCEKVHPDLLLATDPDADRVGIAVKDGNDYQLLSGNEVGVLLLDFICRMRREANTMPCDPVAVTTIVSTSLVDDVARAYDVEVRRVLTGFKYIGGVIAELEDTGHPERFIFGFEESYGYLAGTHARDKDAVVASMLICEMAEYYRTKGKNLYRAMQDIYKTYGYHHNRTLSFTFEGSAGAQKMSDLMSAFRMTALSTVGDFVVESIVDYKEGVGTLPPANVIEFVLEGGSKAIVRPSGTEPKIKVYVFAVGKSAEEAEEIADVISSDMSGRMA